MSGGAPTISIALPVHNGARYLNTCLDGIFGQTFPDFELVVNDDGSTDTSLAILGARQDPRLRVLAPRPHQGLFRSLNRLVGECRAPIVKLVCQDDELLPGCLSEVVQFLDAHPTVAMLFHKSVIVDADGGVLSQDSVTDLPDTLEPRAAAQHFFFHGCIPGNLSTVAFRKQAFAESGGFDESYQVSGDYELWARLCATRDLGVLQRRLVRLRSHAGQLSRARGSGLRFIRENRRIRRTVLERLPAGLRAKALRFEQARHDVLDWHYGVRALLALRPLEFGRVVRTLGIRDSWAGLRYWLTTLNNHWRRPAPPFEL